MRHPQSMSEPTSPVTIILRRSTGAGRCPKATGQHPQPSVGPGLATPWRGRKDATLLHVLVSVPRAGRLGLHLVVRVVVIRFIPGAGGRAACKRADNITLANGACAAARRQPRRAENVSTMNVQKEERINSHALGVEFVATGQAHDAADAVNVLLQTNHAFDLSAHVLLPLA